MYTNQYNIVSIFFHNIVVNIWDSKTSRNIFSLDTGCSVHSVCPHINHSHLLGYITEGKSGMHWCFIKFWLLSSDSVKYLDLRNPQECLVHHKVEMDARKCLVVSSTEIIIV